MGELGYIFLALLGILLLAVLALQRPHQRGELDSRLTIHDLLPIHYREYEQVERRLTEYEALLQRIRLERHNVALHYADALRDDFMRVECLLNHAAKFLPDIRLADECERFLGGLKFRAEYYIVRACIGAGFVPDFWLGVLTRQVRVFSDWADRALAEVARAYGLPVLNSDLQR
jgi:hypothetical protein